MLHTIEVEVDAKGTIHPLQPLPDLRERRALLTLVVPEQPAPTIADNIPISSLFGMLRAPTGVSLERIEATVQERLRTRWHDRD